MIVLLLDDDDDCDHFPPPLSFGSSPSSHFHRTSPSPLRCTGPRVKCTQHVHRMYTEHRKMWEERVKRQSKKVTTRKKRLHSIHYARERETWSSSSTSSHHVRVFCFISSLLFSLSSVVSHHLSCVANTFCPIYIHSFLSLDALSERHILDDIRKQRVGDCCKCELCSRSTMGIDGCSIFKQRMSHLFSSKITTNGSSCHNFMSIWNPERKEISFQCCTVEMTKQIKHGRK